VRPPADVLVVDSAILIAAVWGNKYQALVSVSERRSLMITERTLAECTRRLALGMKRPDLVPAFSRLITLMERKSVDDLAVYLAAAEMALADSIPGGAGSTNDAHVLACAWSEDADIWSFDRDFAGTGVASWSTANLLRALAAEG
jgi:predicted nucleic acid-binding protein